MEKKAAIELSANFLVIIIIAIIVFSMGIYLAYQMLSLGEREIREMDDFLRTEIDRALTTGSRVAVGINSATINRGQNHIFGVGIRNDGQQGTDFSINIEFIRFVSTHGEEIELGKTEIEDVWFESTRSVTIPEYSKEFFSIPMHPIRRALHGTYEFNVEVTHLNQRYGDLQKLYLTIR